MWCLILGYYFKGLTAGRAEPQGLCCSDSSIPAGQSCWYSRLKVSGGHGDEQRHSVLFHPQIPSKPVRVLVMFPIWWHFKAMCVGSRPVNDGELLTKSKGRLTAMCRQRWESMNENARLFDVRWKETASVCCTATLLCSAKGFFFWNVSHFLKIFLGFWWNIYSILHHCERATVCL